VYRVKEGDVFKVGEINVNIAGEFPHTRQTVVLNRLSLRPGDIIDTREIHNSERRLKASQLFNTDPQQGDPPRITVRPPDFSSLGGLAYGWAQPETVRGQNPEATYPAVASPPQVSPTQRTGTTQFTWDGRRGP
jgi:outer membrane protein insertion porin family